MLFESGAVAPTGAIAGNDNDDDAARFEPHYDEIRIGGPGADLRVDHGRRPRHADDRSAAGRRGTSRTTGCCRAASTSPRRSADVAVHGAATGDADFRPGGDRVRYAIDVSKAQGPVTMEAELRFQTISFRWARNLATYAAAETKRFASYYDSMAQGSSLALARALATID